MPEQKMSYQERLLLAAQKHADKWNRHGYLDSNGEAYLMATPNEMIEEAETTVAAQAEAIRKAMMHAFESCDINPEVAGTTIDWYIQEYGYIDPKT